jgi:hypothetical protein
MPASCQAHHYRFDNTLTALEITLGLGLLLFLFWDRLHALGHRIHWLDRYGPAAAYEHALHGLARLAAGQTRHAAARPPERLPASDPGGPAGWAGPGALRLEAFDFDWPAPLAWPGRRLERGPWPVCSCSPAPCRRCSCASALPC